MQQIFKPTVTVALTDDFRLQARIDVVTRTNSYQIRTGDYTGDMISVYLIVRRFWGDGVRESYEELLRQLAEKSEHLAKQYVLPRIIQPLRSAIGSRS
ncbi:MAG: hypothetical protein KatS3mg104_3191 [Phycisphaerae bacterium]|nr:MAG: hypothetical protein KatS3mg104_3191 [Phycisphaerae bacterium]